MSNSSWPHELQHTRLSSPSLSPGICSNSCPLSRWCHPTISSSVAFFFCLQSLPASGPFPVSWLFTSGGQSTGASASASVLLVNIQGWFPLGLNGLISLLSRGSQESSPYHSSKPSNFSHSAFQLSHPYCLPAAAAAAKSLQSCPTLCNPIDGSPPGSPVPGILQARTLEWVAISFSDAWKWKVKVKSLSRVRLFATPWTAAYQAPPSMGFARQEYWSGVPSPSPTLSAYFITNPASLFSSNFLLTHYSSLENKDPRVQKAKQSPQEPVQGVVNTLKELSGTNHIFNKRLLELETATQGMNKLCYPSQSSHKEMGKNQVEEWIGLSVGR